MFKKKIIYMFIFLLLINKSFQEEGNEEAPAENGSKSGSEEDEELSEDKEEDISIYEELLEKKYLEKSRQNLKEEDEGKLDVFALLAEENHSWLFENKEKLINIVIICLVTIIILLISLKVYRINEKIIEQNKKVQEFARNVENIMQNNDSNEFISWKDQKEGIFFVPNPFYKKKEKEKGSEESLKEDIDIINKNLEEKENEIDVLSEKVQQYLEDIADLKKEYDLNKKKVIDEGNNEGANNVLRQFK